MKNKSKPFRARSSSPVRHDTMSSAAASCHVPPSAMMLKLSPHAYSASIHGTTSLILLCTTDFTCVDTTGCCCCSATDYYCCGAARSTYRFSSCLPFSYQGSPRRLARYSDTPLKPPVMLTSPAHVILGNEHRYGRQNCARNTATRSQTSRGSSYPIPPARDSAGTPGIPTVSCACTSKSQRTSR